MSVYHASLSFPLLPPRPSDRRAALTKPVAGRPICDRSPPSGGPDLIFATILQARRRRWRRGRREEGVRRLCNGCGRADARRGGWRLGGQPGCSFALSFPSLARSLTSHDDAVSPLPSLLPPFLEPRAPRPRPGSVDDDDDDEHTCSPARSLARSRSPCGWTNCKVFSRENCATHAKANSGHHPSLALLARSFAQGGRLAHAGWPAFFERFFCD